MRLRRGRTAPRFSAVRANGGQVADIAKEMPEVSKIPFAPFALQH
jgi:hypothetical protein